MRRVMPYYTYARKNLPFQFDTPGDPAGDDPGPAQAV